MEYGIRNVVPSYASIEEGALHLIEESERTFTEMMKEIGISELQSFEETGVLVEAVNVKETIDKIINWFKEKMEAFKGFVDKALNEINKKISDGKKHLVKYEKIKKVVSELKDGDKVYGTYYEYKDLHKYTSLNVDCWKKAVEFKEFVEDEFTANVGTANDIKDDITDKKAKLVEVLPGKNDSERLSNLKKAIRGEEVKVTKDFLVDRWTFLWNYATEYNKSSKEIKKQYNDIKKQTDNVIKTIERAKNKNNGFNNLGMYIEGLKFATSAMHCISSATISAVAERARLSMMICLKLSVAVKTKEEKEKKAEPVKESALSTTKFEAEIATLFDI